jgi:hypothetical protein
MDDFHVPLIEISPRSSLVARNIFRKSGVAMATPRSIVDQVTVRLDCQETVVDFDPLRDRSWPLAILNDSSLPREPGAELSRI